MEINLSALKLIAIALMFFGLFSTAAFEKWRSLKTPDWFLKQFQPTFLAKLPGGIKMGYWGIACFEALLSLAFFAAFFYTGILPLALTLAMFQFAFLMIGLRLSGDYQGSANMFTYFAATVVSLLIIQ